MTQGNEESETYWDDGKAVPCRTRSEMVALLESFSEQIGPLDCWSLGALEALDERWKYRIEDERFIRANGGRPNPNELGEPKDMGEPFRCFNASYKKDDAEKEDPDAWKARYQVPVVACRTCGLVISPYHAVDGECERCASWVKPKNSS